MYENEYGYRDNQAMGVYTPDTQLDFDPIKLSSLGFSIEEIQTIEYIVCNGGRVTTQGLTGYGISYEAAKRLRYMYDIMVGKVVLESSDDLIKHLRKMNPHVERIGMQNLAISSIREVPRKALIANITDPTFKIYNSKQYPLDKRMFDVVDVSSSRIFMETSIRPVLKYKQSKIVEGVIEITEEKPNKKLIIAVDKKYCRLCNRFVIVASMRRPEFHFGNVEIICIEGSRVHVYAQKMGIKEGVKYNGSVQRVYDYGYLPQEIQPKLMACATGLYRQVCGVYAAAYGPTDEYNIIVEEQRIDTGELDGEAVFDE